METIDGHTYNLADDGTMDTVVQVWSEKEQQWVDFTYSTECAAAYREEDGSFTVEGFRDFCEEVVALDVDTEDM